MDAHQLKNIVEAVLLAADRPLNIDQLAYLLGEGQTAYSRSAVRDALKALEREYRQRGVEIKRVGSGYRFQVRQELSVWVSRLWEEKPPRYSRALLETLALIAYRQPITRGEIEAIRGVTVSTGIMKTLQEREWIKAVGYRDTPGRPAMYATTRQFLDYFNLSALDELPALEDLVDANQAKAPHALHDSAIDAKAVTRPVDPGVDAPVIAPDGIEKISDQSR